MAFVNQYETKTAYLGEFLRDATERQHFGAQAVTLPVIFPHLHEVLRADDKRLNSVIVLEDARERRRHQSFAESDDIADEHAAALIQVMRRNFYRRRLKGKEPVAKIARNAKLCQSVMRPARGDMPS